MRISGNTDTIRPNAIWKKDQYKAGLSAVTAAAAVVVVAAAAAVVVVVVAIL